MERNVLNTDLTGKVAVITGVCIPIDGGFSPYSGV